MSLCSSADGAMGSSVTSASTRLVADEGEMGLGFDGLGFDGHPEGLDRSGKDGQEGQARPT